MRNQLRQMSRVRINSRHADVTHRRHQRHVTHQLSTLTVVAIRIFKWQSRDLSGSQLSDAATARRNRSLSATSERLW